MCPSHYKGPTGNTQGHWHLGNMLALYLTALHLRPFAFPLPSAWNVLPQLHFPQCTPDFRSKALGRPFLIAQNITNISVSTALLSLPYPVLFLQL